MPLVSIAVIWPRCYCGFMANGNDDHEQAKEREVLNKHEGLKAGLVEDFGNMDATVMSPDTRSYWVGGSTPNLVLTYCSKR